MTDDKLSFSTNLFRDVNFPELDMEQHAGYNFCNFTVKIKNINNV
jgi:hypothetical protein